MDAELIRSVLTRRGLISDDMFRKLAGEALVHGYPVEQAIIRAKILPADELNALLAEELDVSYIDLSNYLFEPETVRLVPAELARRRKVIPAFHIGDSLTVAMANPQDITALDELRRVTGRNITPALSSLTDIERAINEQYGAPAPQEADVAAALSEFDNRELTLQIAPDMAGHSDEELAGEAPIVRFVNNLLEQAVREHASDIHLEPDEQRLRVRFRIDGIMHIASQVPVRLAPAVVSRVKILARMNIAEKRKPQDGQFEIPSAGHTVDVRVSSLPTVTGENLVLRLLDRASVMIGMEEMGFDPAVLSQFQELLRRPYGILLVTGPTGSGKTTTLYAALQTINSEAKHIVTLEDPVEYRLPLIRQCQVNPKAGITFASGLRAILRQDPDIIMVGEIRDPETAEIAIQASMTGHLVLSTLHTNDSAGAITRLVDMGIEPFLVGSSVIAVLAQRLVRKTCERCRSSFRPEPELLNATGLPPDILLSRGQGCSFCRQTGYRGRIGLFELLKVDDQIRRLTMARNPSSEISNYAVAQGMQTLRDDGIRKVRQGLTTVEELVKATAAGDNPEPALRPRLGF
jgi:type IV pilus assembly protein PilB